MTKINLQAKELNNIIKKSNPSIYSLLSIRGKNIYFPREGIMSQSIQAKKARLNATIGIALDDNAVAMNLKCILNNINLDPNEIFPYSSSFGELDLRVKWRKKILAQNSQLQNSNISTPVPTSGVTHALSIAGYLFGNDNEEIIIHDLFWGNYKLIFNQVYGLKIKTYNTFSKNGLDILSFKKALTDSKSRKKIILFNFPNNPSGYSPVKSETIELVNVIKNEAEKGSQIVVFIDDAYFGLFYEDSVYKQSLFSLLSNAHKNILAVKLDGATKEHFVWGLRVGFITFGSKKSSVKMLEALEQKTVGAVRGTISNVSHLSQSLIIHASKSKSFKAEKRHVFTVLKKRYKEVKRVLNSNKNYQQYFSSLPFNSGYFMCLKLTSGLDAESVRQKLLNKYSTGIIAMKDNLLRVAFSCIPESKIDEYFENVHKACKLVASNSKK